MSFEVKRVLNIFGLMVVLCWSADGQISHGSECPKVSLDGPQGITSPGSLIKVLAKTVPEVIDLGYSWTVDAGTISREDGGASIIISTDPSRDNLNITVNLKIDGLPEGCVATVSGKFPVGSGISDVFPVDEYQSGWSDRERAGLDVLGIQISATEDDQKAYIVLEFKTGTSQSEIEKRIGNIKKFLFVKRKYPKDRFIILGKHSPAPRTTFWIWPEGSSFPMCDGCRKY